MWRNSSREEVLLCQEVYRCKMCYFKMERSLSVSKRDEHWLIYLYYCSHLMKWDFPLFLICFALFSRDALLWTWDSYLGWAIRLYPKWGDCLAFFSIFKDYHVILFTRQVVGKSQKLYSSLIMFKPKKRFTFVNSWSFLRIGHTPLIPTSQVGGPFGLLLYTWGLSHYLFVR